MRWDALHPLELQSPRMILTGDLNGATLQDRDRTVKRWHDPLDGLRWLQASWDSGAIPYDQCWIGYLGYDLGRCFEDLPVTAAETLHTPLFAFGHTSQPELTCPTTSTGIVESRSTFTRPQYLEAVRSVIDYIAAGDVFQVNLSQRFCVATRDAPREIFRRLHSATPAAQGALLQLRDFALISNSPELFLRVTPDRRVITRPIKGTRPARRRHGSRAARLKERPGRAGDDRGPGAK
jgi:anthranilate/para-aminobenzoate synthase component I